MGHAAQENLLDESFPLGAHDDEGDVPGFQDPKNGRQSFKESAGRPVGISTVTWSPWAANCCCWASNLGRAVDWRIPSIPAMNLTLITYVKITSLHPSSGLRTG